MYRPQLGRFLSPDRYESATADLALQLDPTTNNRYVFSAADPINNTDIDGHEPPSSYTNGCDVMYGSDERCAQEGEQAKETSERDQQTVTYAYSSNWLIGRTQSPQADIQYAKQYAEHHVARAEEATRAVPSLPGVVPPAPSPVRPSRGDDLFQTALDIAGQAGSNIGQNIAAEANAFAQGAAQAGDIVWRQLRYCTASLPEPFGDSRCPSYEERQELLGFGLQFKGGGRSGGGGRLGAGRPGTGQPAAKGAERTTRLLGPGTSFGAKIDKQLAGRGWTKRLVQSTIDDPARTVATRDTRYLPGGGRMDDPATGYISRRGGYVIRNDRTGDIEPPTQPSGS